MTSPAHTFPVVSSELLFDAPIIAVRRDMVEMPGGSVVAREIVEHFGAVAVVAFDGERIALVRQWRQCVRRRLWELPAGLLDVSGEDPLVCAQRELREEAGLRADAWSVITDMVSSPGFCEESVRIFFATDLSVVDRPEGKDEEADLVLEWRTPDEIKRMITTGEIVNSIALTGLLMGLHALDDPQWLRPVDTPFELRPQSMSARRGTDRGVDMKFRR